MQHLTEEEQQKLSDAIYEYTTMPPELLTDPFGTFRHTAEEQIEAPNAPLVAELVFLQALSTMVIWLWDYHARMNLFDKYDETKPAAELMDDCDEAIVKSFIEETGIVLDVYKKRGEPSVISALAKGKKLIRVPPPGTNTSK